MSYYLLDNPNPYQVQYRAGRRGRLTGGVLIHTTESPKGNGAGPIAHWIATQRRDHGSYHVIVDADRALVMAPDDYEVWHCAARGFNQATFGISIAGRSTDLNPDDEWTKKVFGQLALQLAAFFKRNRIDVNAGAVFRPAQQLLSGPGLANHGDAQPWDRSDAFARHPRRGDLERLLIDGIRYFAGAAAPPPAPSIPTPPGVDLNVNKPVMMREPDGTVWMYYSGTPWRVHVKSVADVATFQYFGIELKGVDRNQAAFFRRYSQAVKTK